MQPLLSFSTEGHRNITKEKICLNGETQITNVEVSCRWDLACSGPRASNLYNDSDSGLKDETT